MVRTPGFKPCPSHRSPIQTLFTDNSDHKILLRMLVGVLLYCTVGGRTTAQRSIPCHSTGQGTHHPAHSWPTLNTIKCVLALCRQITLLPIPGEVNRQYCARPRGARCYTPRAHARSPHSIFRGEGSPARLKSGQIILRMCIPI